MKEELKRAVEELVSRETGAPARVRGSAGAGGGCINDARVVELEDGRSLFVKSNPRPLPGMFEREAEGLAALAAVGAIRVPRPLGSGSSPIPFIVMEHIASGRPGAGFHERFGRSFAELHRASREERFGFASDNYIGSTPQPNGWSESWVDFWRQRRLGFQLELARTNGLSDGALDRLGDSLLARLDELIGSPEEPPCLLHGDLWGGNYMVDERGAPVLIDPAAYFGRREADLAMTLVFGGFDRPFYDAYDEVWPLAPGSEERLEVYKLYHLLNHLNLFGPSYRSGCLAILRRFE